MTPPKPPFFPPWLFTLRTARRVGMALFVLVVECIASWEAISEGVPDFSLLCMAVAVTLALASCWIVYRHVVRDWSEWVELRRTWDEYFSDRERR